MTSSARIRRRDKQFESLVKENVKLHDDVQELEKAYQLHRHTVEQDRNSVHGLIRNEIGGSRWQHGGSGKLTTYKSSKDLIDDPGTSKPMKHKVADSSMVSSKTSRLKQQSSLEIEGNRRVKLMDDLRSTENFHGSMENERNENKILDLKAKVLKKASTKIIRRDTWAGHSDVKNKVFDRYNGESDHDTTFDNMKKFKKNVLKSKVIDEKAIPNSSKVYNKQKDKSDLKYYDQRSGETPTRRSRLDIHEITKKAVDVDLEKEKIDSYKGQENTREMPVRYIHQYSYRSNAESQNPESSVQNVTEVNSNVTENVLVSNASETFNPTKAGLISENDENIGPVNDTKFLNGSLESTDNFHCIKDMKDTEKSVNIMRKSDTGLETFQTEAPEPTEIYIDTESGQIRIKSGDENTPSSPSNFDGTKVLIQQRPVNKSVDGQKLPCTIVRESQSFSAQQEVRDIFGLAELNSDLKSVSNKELNSHGSSVSPFALVKECNSEVEFWLHGLGLQDIDKYVKIFADHEIDLLDLEFMTAAQLHDMGVTALGALNKILKGVKDLRGASMLSQSSLRDDPSRRKHLQMSSIAWEEDKDGQKRRVRKSVDTNLNIYKDKNKCDESMVSKSSDILATRQNSVRESRPSSVLSVHSDCEESISSSRSKVSSTHPSFTASTKASSAKCVGKRPPSSKSASQPKSKSQPKSHGKVKRNESNMTGKSAFGKSAFRLSQLEGKPTKGVLLRPRSSSLSREVMPRKPIKQEREDKEVKSRNLRYRSRSADAVKRKAMEGVQTAAKKFEEKQQRDRDSKQTLYHRDEKMKARRDEMAARHVQREKHRELVIDQSSDTEEEVNCQSSNRDGERKEGLESLVQVNILSQSGSLQNKTAASPTIIYVLPPISPVKSTGKGKSLNESTATEEKSEVHRSLRRVEPARRPGLKSLAKPVELQLNTAKIPPGKLTAKMNLKDQEKSPRSQSEPESGYKTDGSSSYSHIEDRVSEIQKKIKRLKAQASTGDDLTGTLVQDLQIQLQQFEQILGTKHSNLSKEPTGIPGNSNEERNLEKRGSNHGLLQSASMEARKSSPIEELLAEDQKIKMNPDTQVGDEEVVRMSKRELLDEMRKEKKHHHLQIRQLQKELERIRHADPVTSMEIQMSDIIYREEDMIGEGAFSQVYKGLYQGSEVAIKKLKVPLRSQDRNYFTAELSLLKELRHPRVVLLIGVCTTDKLPLMVLEYMSQGSLYNYLHDPENEPFDHALYFQVARDITAGMKYLHSHKPEVIHLDLKSMNVLLCQSYRAKIGDFGFSKLRHDAGVKSKRNTKQTNVSTPAWMSPELLNKGEITTKSDVYSFAVILWEMLTRKEPYSNLSVFQILERVRKNKRPEIPVSAPEGLQLLISQCWDPNPAKRPNFKDILQVLESLEFPPAWRELFKKAGVPDEALSNVYSTRNIIKLVTDTLDLPGYPNFMLTPMPKVRESSRYFISDNAMKVASISSRSKTSLEEVTGVLHNATSNNARKLDSQRDIISEGDKWESDTVTTVSGGELSDESEVTLKDIKDSSSDESALSSDTDVDRPDTVSDIASTDVPVTPHKLQRRPVNVFIPNLELSIESARKEFSAERDRISRSSWLSISLDDRTNRCEENQAEYKAEKYVNKSKLSETSLNLLSNRSDGGSSPSDVLLTEDSKFNESARKRRRNRHVKSPTSQSSSEYIMRESFSNRRPPSPKKKSSLTKKLLDKSLNLASNTDSAGNNTVRLDSVPVNTVDSLSDRSIKSLGNRHVDCSYDSFFGIPIQNNETEEIENSSVQTSNISSELNTQGTIHDCGITFDKQDESFEVDRKKISVTKSDMYLVESESEIVPKESRQNRTEVVNEVKRFIDQKLGTSLSVSRDEMGSECSVSRHAESQLPHMSSKVEPHFSADCARSSQDNSMTSSVNKNICQIDSVVNECTKTAKNLGIDNDANGERNIYREPTEIVLRTSNKSVTAEPNHLNVDESLKHDHFEIRAGSKSARTEKHENDKFDISKNDTRHSIDVNIRPRSSKVPKIDEDKLTKEKRTNVPIQLELPKRKDINSNASLSKSAEIKHDGGEQIRVVLNPRDVTDKKKPAITPRKSKMKTQQTVQQVEQTGKSMSISDKAFNEPKENEVETKNTCLKKSLEDSKSQILGQNTKADNLTSASMTRASNSLALQEPEVAQNELPKSNKIRVKLRKDPLAPKLVAQCPSSPVPPAPPPPPVGNFAGSMSVLSKSMQIEAPRLSMADELKNKISKRQSISEGITIVRKNTGNTFKPVKPENIIGARDDSLLSQSSKPVKPAKEGEPITVPTNTENDLLAPQPSDGLPSFVVQSLELKDQKDHLRSISKPHPNQIDDLSGASQEQLSSIADILRKAVMGRRFAMGEDADSVSQSFDSVATGWSMDLN